jgi:hypothetical protein
MEVEFGDDQLPIQRCLILTALITKTGLTRDDYEKYLRISALDKHEEIGNIPVDELVELNDCLRQLGQQSFRDLQHLQKIAFLIQRSYWTRQGSRRRLEAMEGQDLVDWVAQCDANRTFYMNLTDPNLLDYEEEVDDIGLHVAWWDLISDPWWRKLWWKVLRLIRRKKRFLPDEIESGANMN